MKELKRWHSDATDAKMKPTCQTIWRERNVIWKCESEAKRASASPVRPKPPGLIRTSFYTDNFSSEYKCPIASPSSCPWLFIECATVCWKHCNFKVKIKYKISIQVTDIVSQ